MEQHLQIIRAELKDFFCYNKCCPCHVEMGDVRGDMMKFVAHNGKTVETRRFKVVIQPGEKTLYFCSTCVMVASLINAK